MPKLIAKVLVGFVVLFALMFCLGPRPLPVDGIPLHAVDLPSDLDTYLTKKEAKIPRLRPQLAQYIQWANPATKARTAVSIVYLHSYTGSAKELSPVIEEVGHRLNANVFFNRYSGHGQDTEAMRPVKVEDWLEETNEALAIGQRLGDKVVLIGFSTGGTLATWLTAHQAPVAAQILLSPNFAPKDWRASFLLWPWGDRLVSAANHGSRYREWVPDNGLQRARWTYRQPVESLVTMMSLVEYVNKLDFTQVKSPTMVFYTDIDKTVSVERIKKAFRQFSAIRKELVNLPNARWHVLTGDAFSPNTNQEVIDRMTTFLQSTTH